MVAGGEDWAAFVSTVDVAALFDRLRAGDALTPELVREWAVVFVQQGEGSFGSYTTDVERLPELGRRPFLMSPATAAAPS
jgi:hypothetical protein